MIASPSAAKDDEEEEPASLPVAIKRPVLTTPSTKGKKRSAVHISEDDSDTVPSGSDSSSDSSKSDVDDDDGNADVERAALSLYALLICR